MKYTCTKEIPICEFYERGECHNMEDCALAKPVVEKPLGDWTLAEVKALCKSRGSCVGCPFEKNEPYEYKACVLHGIPFIYKLDKEEKA